MFHVFAVLLVLVAVPPLSLASTWATSGLSSAQRHDGPSSVRASSSDVALTTLSYPGVGPYVAPAFKADMVLVTPGGTKPESRGTFIRDADNERFRRIYCFEEPLFRPGDQVCMDELNVNYTGPVRGYNMNYTVGKGSDSMCRVLSVPYSDTFVLLAIATYQGNSTVAGEPCELWVASWQEFHDSACLGWDGVPRQFNSSSPYAPYTVLTLSNISVGPQPAEAFRPSEVCSESWPAAPCPNAGLESLIMYRVRSLKEPNSLENRNAGDALGDMAFFCSLAGLDESQVVTSWSVQANSSWGQYAYCLYQDGKNVCFNGSGNHVGRQSALGLGDGPQQGQCSGNAKVGSWFSFPADGQCPDGAPVGEAGCTWTAQPLRTVSARCILEDRGLKASCEKERGHAPLLRSAAIFRSALATADPAQGGCPDVDEASATLIS